MPWPFPLGGSFPTGWVGSYGGIPMMSFDATGSTNHRNNIFYVGDTVSIRVTDHTATSYEVRDIFGAVLASGTPAFTPSPWVDSSTINAGGYDLNLGSGYAAGWYVVYFYGTNVDANYGTSLGKTNFVVLRTHPNFPTPPTSTFSNYSFHPSGHAVPGPGDTYTGPTLDSPFDAVVRGVLGMGPGRLSLVAQNNPFVPDAGTHDRLTDNVTYLNQSIIPYLLSPGSQYVDTVRGGPKQFIEFPSYQCTYDILQAPNDGTKASYLVWAEIYPINATIDPTKIFVEVIPGTGTGGTMNVYYPDATTLVETYNVVNNNDIDTQINGTSSYIAAYAGNNVNAGTLTKQAIGNVNSTALKSVVSTLYPLGVTYYEGPENEPGLGYNIAHQYMLFQAAVHAAEPSAKAMGPCNVDINNGAWVPFFAKLNALGVTPDVISFHDYNTTLSGDVNQGRNNIERFLGWVKDAGFGSVELWQTEATGGQADVMHAALHTPRRARAILARILLWEQYGVPREHNPYWYDDSHGFWGDTGWIINEDQSLNPQAVLICVLNQETFGKNHHHRIDFGSVPANNMFLGSVYGDPVHGSVAVIQCMSAMPSSTVTLTVNGTTAPLTVVTGQGVESTVSQSSGRVTINLDEFPTYVRLPAGVTVSVYSVRDHGNNPNPNIAAAALSAKIGGSSVSRLVDGKFLDKYTGGSTSTGTTFSTSTLPDTVEVKFNQSFTVSRVDAWCGPPYQHMCAMLTYTVDTWDGTSWTTQTTVTKSPPASFKFGEYGENTGSTYEQFYDDGWIESVTLPTPVSCQGIRFNVSAASYGGAVDTNADSVANGWGASTSTPMLTVQDIAVISGTAVAAISDLPTEILADSPSGYWKLNEAVGSSTAVSQVNSPTVDGAATNTPVFGSTAIVQADTSVDFRTGCFQIPAGTFMDLGDVFTIETWLLPQSDFASANSVLFHKGSGGATNTPWLELTGPKLVLYPGASRTAIASTPNLQASTPYHIMVTKNGATTKIYVNGDDVTVAGTNATLTNNTQATQIGNSNGSTRANMAHFAIYQGVALSQSRAATHYLSGVFPSAPTNVNAPVIEGA